MFPNYNQKTYELEVMKNEKLAKDGKTNLISKEVLNQWDAKQIFLKSEIGRFKIYQN